MKLKIWRRRETPWCQVWELTVLPCETLAYIGDEPVAWHLPDGRILHARY